MHSVNKDSLLLPNVIVFLAVGLKTQYETRDCVLHVFSPTTQTIV